MAHFPLATLFLALAFHVGTAIAPTRRLRLPSQGLAPAKRNPAECGTATEVAEWSSTFANLAPHKQGEHVTRAYTPRGNSTLLVEADVSAWNNVRMSWETAVCLAYKTKRIYRVPHIPVDSYADIRLKFVEDGKLRQLNMFDYYDEASFRRVIPSVLDSDPLPEGETFSPEADPWMRPILQLSGYPHLIYKQGPGHVATRIFQQFANVKDFLPHEEYVDLIQNAFRLRQDVLCRTINRLIDYDLRPRGYVALHRRRGDTINIKEYNVSAEAAATYVEPLVRGQTVLVLTDTYEPDFLQFLRNVSGAARVVCWADQEWTGEDQVLSVQIDMLAAVGAQEFIGTPSSTVSTGIVRWRTQAGTHKVGDPIHFTRDWEPGYLGWPSPGAKGTYL